MDERIPCIMTALGVACFIALIGCSVHRDYHRKKVRDCSARLQNIRTNFVEIVKNDPDFKIYFENKGDK